MKKVFLFAAVAALGLSSCQKTSDMEDKLFVQKAPQQEEKIPIAKVTESGDIELLFYQKDVQEAFNKENSDLKLGFVEVQDDSKTGKNAGLLFQLYDEKNGVKETSVSQILTFDDGVYYAPPATSLQNAGGGYSATSITCSTNCSWEKGCVPKKSGNTWICSESSCSCTKSITTSTDFRVANLVSAINCAVLVYR
ncbi:MAG: hypothetical protein LBT27_10085 [Prevotellaceae bacterium]|jgi:hypothetical protein|nr:hypothetical protein [Prevotellaceae bacterium]